MLLRSEWLVNVAADRKPLTLAGGHTSNRPFLGRSLTHLKGNPHSQDPSFEQGERVTNHDEYRALARVLYRGVKSVSCPVVLIGEHENRRFPRADRGSFDLFVLNYCIDFCGLGEATPEQGWYAFCGPGTPGPIITWLSTVM